jgi:isoleucyl-tRNA synthetase
LHLLVNQLRSEVNKILETARTGKLIGASLDAKVYLHAENADTVSKLKELASATNDADALHRLFITSQVEPFSIQNERPSFCMHYCFDISFFLQVEILPSLSEETMSGVSYTGKFSDPRTGDIWIGVTRADGAKCERCWVYAQDVGSFVDHPSLCSRCHGVIDLQPEPSREAAAVV